MKKEILQDQVNLPEYYWEIQVHNNVTDELIRMVKRETLSEALNSASSPTDSNPILNISLIHRTEDTLLAASLVQGELPLYFHDMTGATPERVPERFHKEFKKTLDIG